MFVAVLSYPPSHIESWLSGYEGERWTAKQLRTLGKREWFVRHDVQRANWNWDHVALGSPGLFLIETKRVFGTAELQTDGTLRVVRLDDEQESFVYDRLHRLIKGNAKELNRTLKEKTNQNPWISPVVAIWHSFPKGFEEFDGVVYVAGDRLAGWLRQLPPKFDGPRRQELATALAKVIDAQP